VVTRADVAAVLRSIVAEEFQVSVDDIRDEARLVELGLDSFGAIELMALLEQQFGIKLENSGFDGVGTFADVVALVVQRVGAREPVDAR
jgi:acyl carrier protein